MFLQNPVLDVDSPGFSCRYLLKHQSYDLVVEITGVGPSKVLNFGSACRFSQGTPAPRLSVAHTICSVYPLDGCPENTKSSVGDRPGVDGAGILDVQVKFRSQRSLVAYFEVFQPPF